VRLGQSLEFKLRYFWCDYCISSSSGTVILIIILVVFVVISIQYTDLVLNEEQHPNIGCCDYVLSL